MQAQLGLSLSHLSIKELYLSHPQTTAPMESLPSSEPPVKKTVSFLIEDSADRIQELEDLISVKSLTLKGLVRLLRSHSEFCLEGSPEIGQQGSCQRLLENWKFQQEVDSETMRQSLARAGESIHSYESRLLAMEDMLGRDQKVESRKTPYGPLCQIEDHSESHEFTVRALSHRVELLKSENGALNQRYQEIVNQLTEADREIDRLKAELINLQGGKQHLLILEELNGVRARLAESQANAVDRDFYERELDEKSVKLHEALVTLEVLESSLNDTERRLQLKEATLKGLGFQMAEEGAPEEKGQLKEQLEATGAKLLEKEELCRELQAQNIEFQARNQESEGVQSLKLLEAENEIRMLRAKLGVKAKSARGEREVIGSEDLMQTGERKVADKSVIKQVVGEIKMKSEALSRVLEVLVKLDVSVEKTLIDLKSSLHITDCLGYCEEEPDEVSQRVMKRLVLEAAFWSGLLNALEVSPCKTEGERACSFQMRVVQRTVAEKSMLLLMNRICPRPKMEVDNEMAVTAQTVRADLSDWCSWLDNDTNTLILKDLTEALQEKVYLLNLIASTIEMSTNDTLLSLVLASFDSGKVKKQWSEHLEDAATEAHMSYLISRLKFQHEKELKETQVEKLQIGNSDCANCCLLREQNRELQSKLADQQNHMQCHEGTMSEDTRPVTHIQIEGEPIDSLDKAIQLQDMVAKHKLELRETKDVYTQVTENLRQEVAKVSEILRLEREENVKEIDSLTVCMENLKKKHETERIVLLEKFHHQMDVTPGAGYPTGAEDGTMSPETSTTSALKERIQELVAQVSAMTEEMKRRELQGDAATLRLKYDKDLENLKATCERGFAAMEESHQRVIEELQRKNQRALENLHEEKERLLAEETAATISAIEAMKNAHRSELEKELDKARKSNSNTENADIEEICRQHEEELCSFQREIEVLSEQYSQKCLENAHLAQALEAERQALRQCQRENQELNAHNQELNNRLAAEITKIRSMAAEDGGGNTCNITHGKELYELEVSSAPGELYELEVSSAPGELYELEVSSAPGELYELEVSSAPGELYELEVSSAPGELYELEVSSAPGELYELEVSSAPGELYELEVSSAPGELYELEVSSAPGEQYELEVSSAPGELYELEVSSAPGELYELEVSSAPGELYELEVSSAPGELYELEVSSAPGELYELEVSSAPGELYELEVSSAPGELYELEVSSAPGELYELEVSSAPGELYELEVSSAPGELYELEVSSAPGELYELEVSSAPGELYELEVSSAPGELYELEVSSAPGELYELEVSSAPGELYELEVSSAPGELYELEVSSAPGELYELEVSSAPGELYELEVSSAPGELYELEVSSAPGELYELEVSSAPGELYELEVSSAPGEQYELEVSSAPGELYELEVSSAPGELYELEVSSAPGELYELEVSSAPGELYELEVSSAPGELYELEVSSAPGELYELEVSSAPGELYELEVSSAPGELYELEVSSAPGELYELEVSSAPGELYELEVSSAPGEQYELEVSSAPGELYELEVSSAPGELYELEVSSAPGELYELEVSSAPGELYELEVSSAPGELYELEVSSAPGELYELEVSSAPGEHKVGRFEVFLFVERGHCFYTQLKFTP
ncbi:centrosomal protein of 128 kDa-like isoform X3 [Salvelinus namaycush]|uniref:Centrosomal protein of 128 kDa-like isoform X3 n=1 Tax=Salvelinus namaycush TaxID=8040 RepID=A0A8U0QPQ6_SALNM|nr:centrosomal protein of 128 kDa-like isoform X3 [Salvelinus namaycush]